ncbi:DMT family transporter [Helicobacter cappadocius]|uniref:DMT family transporter n=1 Tax=Helicobacter cappadocius TaxID=3063998 RepID=A0AA90PQK2_9HELI|nr:MULTISPECIES: DMT family transporter [unclassified Helicobacter]MDO7253035.1 DMT family transporter [Helicobacter sp. faydin-H75]MDP2538976.1 DMT family transporter [Helicobacter sp. faydin-H76]
MKNKELIFSLLLLIAMAFWGLSWPLSKIMVEYLSPYETASIRFGLVALSFIPIMIYLKIPFKIPKKSFKGVFLTSVFNASYSILFFVGLSLGDAGSAGVIVTTLAPILASIVGTFIHHSTLLRREKVGLFLGLLSGGFLLGLNHISSLFTQFNVIFLIAALLWGSITLSSKSATSYMNAIALNFYSSVFSFIVFFPSFFIFGFSEAKNLGNIFWICMLIVGLLSTTFATTIFYKGVHILGINRGGSFTLLVPVFALLFSWAILGETPSLHTIIGGGIAMLGIYFINLFEPNHFKKVKK